MAAGLVTATAAIFAAGLWVVGRGQYINDYCTTGRAPQQPAADRETLSGRPAYMDGPVSVVCEYDGYPTVTVTDPAPLLGALVLTTSVTAVAVVALSWARREAASRAPPKAHAPRR